MGNLRISTAWVLILAGGIFCKDLPAWQKNADTAETREQEPQKPVRISIETDKGKVSWSKIADVVAQQVGIKIPALQRMATGGELDIKASSTRWILAGVNLALPASIRVSINRRKETIVITIDHAEIERARKKWGAKLRKRVTDFEVANGEKFTIEPYGSNQSLKDERQLVVMIHGLNSSPAIFKTLAEQIEEIQLKEGSYKTAGFHYSSRQGVEKAARQFEEQLRKLVAANPKCELTIVTHSMGGIVARLAIERKGFDQPQIKRIIMVAPPNHGSSIALLPVGGDRFETMLALIEREKIRKMIRNLVGEVNLAVEDLRPNSPLIRKLESLKRRDGVKYSIILGRQAVLTHGQAAVLKTVATRMRASGKKQVIQGGAEIADVLGKLSSELVSPRGDGVVSLASGRLKGVDDVVKLKFQHNDISQEGSREQKAIFAEVIKRLK